MRSSCATVLMVFISSLSYGAESCPRYRFEKLASPPLSEALTEMSGLVLGEAEPDSLIHIRDSGNDALLVYTKRDGTVLNTYPFSEQVTDPEEVTRGSCPWGGGCVFVFDTGDNFHWRRLRSIYAIEEATLKTAKPHIAKMDFTFPGGERLDVEAGVALGNSIYVFTKERKRSRVFRLQLADWGNNRNEAQLITDLPYKMVTGASASRDGSRILLINWQGVIELSGGEGSQGTPWFPNRKRIEIEGMEQQEAVSYDADDRSFLYTSEKKFLSKGNWGIRKAHCEP